MESIFTQEQIDKLLSWKSFLQKQKITERKAYAYKSEEEIHETLKTSNFAQGNNLTPKQIDQIFHLMRAFSRNRALSNLLYTRDNTLEDFNQQLRNLYYGSAALPERVNNFFEKLDRIGMQTLSQLLLALDSQKYPLITSQTLGALELDANQEQKAMDTAIKKFGITNPDQYREMTLDYLANSIIFEQIKQITQVDKYIDVNFLIWFGNLEDEELEEPLEEQYTSVSLEKDLEGYLKKNPHLLEKGLKLVRSQFPTDVGNIDLLLTDSKGFDVVVELKKGRKSDDVVGQISRYMGWIIKNKNKKTRGIIVVNEPDEKLEYSILPFSGSIKVKYYRVKFDLSDEYVPDKVNSID